MRKLLLSAAALAVLSTAAFAEPIHVKARLDNLAGTPIVIVISSLPDEITSITCDRWNMLGVGSWKKQNEFTIPAAGRGGISIAAMNANKFEGYCKTPGSIIGHTDSGDFVGHLDRGDGNWKESTKLTFEAKAE